MSAHTTPEQVRSKIDHPIVDGDGHWVEYDPVFSEKMRKVGGDLAADGFLKAMGRTRELLSMSPAERRHKRLGQQAFWARQAENTLDRATAMMPKLLCDRLDELGLDLVVVYPTAGLRFPRIQDDATRRAVIRAYNTIARSSIGTRKEGAPVNQLGSALNGVARSIVGSRRRAATDGEQVGSRRDVSLRKLDSRGAPLPGNLGRNQSLAGRLSKMPRSVASVFGNPKDLQAALSKDGVLSLLVTGSGRFRARLTQIALNQMGLAAGEEDLSRVAFVAVPSDAVLVSLAIGDRSAPIWGGVEVRVGEMITLGPRQRIHAKTDGPCAWGSIRLSGDDLARYGRALTGAEFVVPPVAKWRPPRAALRQLRHFHRAAIRAAEMRSRALADNEAAHGLEHQLIHAVVECLAGRSVDEETEAALRHRDILAQFEDLLQNQPRLDIAEICGALGISEATLRQCSEEQLGMSPGDYRALRGLQSV